MGVVNAVGLFLCLVGVLILFRYGMPFHVPMGGRTILIAEELDEAEKQMEHRYLIYGYFGLALVVIGTALQIWASLA